MKVKRLKTLGAAQTREGEASPLDPALCFARLGLWAGVNIQLVANCHQLDFIFSHD